VGGGGECAARQYTRIISSAAWKGLQERGKGAAAVEVIGLTLYYYILIIVRVDHHADFNYKYHTRVVYRYARVKHYNCNDSVFN